ncbi:MAG: arginine--tRNA ligase [Candidatus Rifleibacteriota bacterium]
MKKQLISMIHQKLAPLLAGYGIQEFDFIDIQVPPDRSKGDFSMNAAMKLAKAAKCPPIKLAQEMLAILSEEKSWFNKVEIAGPGFINMYLHDDVISASFNEISASPDLGLKGGQQNETTVVDYSSVNIAKQMHVGHLRSTIIGDVLARVIEALGNRVIRQNHLGDWGLPMAMVLFKAVPVLRKAEQENVPAEKLLPLSRLEELYKEATAECKNDEETAKQCHELLVRLQQGDPQLLSDWKKITRISMIEVYRIYRLLDVKLNEENECGESFYRDMLAETVKEIEKSGKLVESQGARCVFLDEFVSKEGNPLPVIVQKSDGAFNYGTFDLAALRYRTHSLKAHRIIYVTDARQVLHFKQIFATARVCGILADETVTLEHVPFGSILGEDNKPLKTRSGENVKLSELLDEAIDKAFQVVTEKNSGLTEEYRHEVAKMVGIGAIKYADLSQNRNNDYVFSFDRMLALNGNTAPYLQYAHARICSIFRKAGIDPNNFAEKARVSAAAERDLMIKILEFTQTVEQVAAELRPHILCNYLYELATAFSTFYDRCPVLAAESEELKTSRLALCNTTRKTLARGLELLGITAPREM